MEERNGSALATPYTGSVEGPRDYRRWLASVWSRRRPCAHHSSDATCPPPLFRACLGCDTRSRDLQNLSVYRLPGIPAYTDDPDTPPFTPVIWILNINVRFMGFAWNEVRITICVSLVPSLIYTWLSIGFRYVQREIVASLKWINHLRNDYRYYILKCYFKKKKKDKGERLTIINLILNFIL